MNKSVWFFSLLIGSCTLLACVASGSSDTKSDSGLEYRVMVFSKTAGFRHASIEAGVEAVKKLGKENGVTVFATEDASHFNSEELDRYDAVIFLNTTGTLFDDEQREAFRAYINGGGGYAGIHSATDTEYEWPWYNKLAGAYFKSHPPGTHGAVLNVTDADHLSTETLPKKWERVDEWYNFSDRNEEVNVLITIDTESYEGSAHPGYHPISWYHEYDGGRAFYTAMGHTSASFEEDELFLEHMWGGIEYAMGRN